MSRSPVDYAARRHLRIHHGGDGALNITSGIPANVRAGELLVRPYTSLRLSQLLVQSSRPEGCNDKTRAAEAVQPTRCRTTASSMDSLKRRETIRHAPHLQPIRAIRWPSFSTRLRLSLQPCSCHRSLSLCESLCTCLGGAMVRDLRNMVGRF